MFLCTKKRYYTTVSDIGSHAFLRCDTHMRARVGRGNWGRGAPWGWGSQYQPLHCTHGLAVGILTKRTRAPAKGAARRSRAGEELPPREGRDQFIRPGTAWADGLRLPVGG